MRASTFLAGLAAGLLPSVAGAGEGPTPAGLWRTEGGWATVRIGPCSGTSERLCGWITSLKEPSDPRGRPKRDTANVDPGLRNRAIVGMPFITNFRAVGSGRWTGGRIYNPGDGKTYASNLALKADGTLKVNGCVLVICKAQTWTRARS